MIRHQSSVISVLCVAFAASAAASDLDRLQVQRQPVYEFTQKPTITRAGDQVTISFTSKAFCDVTVAVEDADGRIVRHLVSGLLGKNAPPPFRKNSLKQVIVWDGKDDRGKYVDDKDACVVRVSLGLRPRFERTLFWSPKKRAANPTFAASATPIIVPAPEGVYVCEGGNGDHVRLFDHDGAYVRTIYPFPADKLAEVKGLKRHAFPQDGKSFPLKWALPQNTLLTSGMLKYGGSWPSGGSTGVLAATAMAVRGKRIALANARLNRLATDGATPRGGSGQAAGLPLGGPMTAFTVSQRDYLGHRKPRHVGPRDAALSPDGNWLYLTGYHWPEYWGTGGTRHRWLNVVARMKYGGDQPAKPFVGSAQRGRGGTDNASFRTPTGVACDARGHVYVADHWNDRIQVYRPDGTFVRSIKVAKPTRLAFHHRTGELYVFSWKIINPYFDGATAVRVPATLTRLGSPDKARVIGKPCPLPLSRHSSKWSSWDRLGGTQYGVALDSWSDPPRVWIGGGGSVKQSHLRIYEFRDGRLVLTRDFGAEAEKEVVWLAAPYHGRQRLYCNPKNGWVYAGHQHLPSNVHSKSIRDLVGVDPRTGKVRVVPLPFDAEDLTFDLQGRLYLRVKQQIARYAESVVGGRWREVPFDYGEEYARLSYQGYRSSPVISALRAWSGSYASGQFGGIAVSPKGRVAVTFDIRSKLPDRRAGRGIPGEDAQRYTPRVFPGRGVIWTVHIWDEHGKVIYDDALPGMGLCTGIHLDKDDNLYVMGSAQRIIGGVPYVNDASCTLIKATPGKAKVLSSGGVVPLGKLRPKRPPDIRRWRPGLGATWIEGAEWLYGGVGIDSHGVVAQWRACHCEANSRPAFDYFGRSFLPEINRYDVAVVDTAGNTIVRIGRPGNVDDGMPLVKKGGPVSPRSIGGDEVALMHGNHLAVHTDRRLFISDLANGRLLSVKLGYHATEKVSLNAER